MSKHLSRRAALRGALRGAAIGVALPPLEAMLDTHGEAFADGSPIPKRFGLWFWGNGVRLQHWVPAQTGTAWDPASKEELAPLAAHKPYLSLATGMEAKSSAFSAHHSGACLMISGTFDAPKTTPTSGLYGQVAGPSLDQIAANAWTAQTKFRSLEVGVSRNGINGGNNGAETSFRGPTSRNPIERSPQLLFDRLFKDGVPAAAGDPQATKLAAARSTVRRSILDAVRSDLGALVRRVGSADRARLDQHLEGIAAIERQLAALGPATAAAACTAPARPGLYPTDRNHEELTKVSQVQTDILATALACDLARAFVFEFTCLQSGVVAWEVGVNANLHDLTHDGTKQELVHKSVVFTMQRLGYFLERFRNTPIGAGNLLDHTCVVATSCVAEGQSHSLRDIPLLLCGRAGGALKGGIHYRSTTRENTNLALLTALRASGVPLPELGKGVSLTSTGLGAFEA